MPIYEYQCQSCGHEFEREQRITDDPIKTCPRCKTSKARRLISRTSFVLKGGGWYSDLYSSPAAKQEQAEKKAATEPSKESKQSKEPKTGKDDSTSSGKSKGTQAKNAA